MTVNTYQTFDEMWRRAVGALVDMPVRQSRDGPCREVVGFSARVLKPTSTCASRRMSPSYAGGELLWYLSWSDDGDHIAHYANQYKRFLEPDGTAYGAYGKRWGAQMESLILQLTEGNRQAVLATWTPRDLDRQTPDKPCTLSLQFLPRDGCLHCVATMRSNDAWLGMPYDTFAFSRLQWFLADSLGLELGSYVHQAGSLHLYERDLEKAKMAIARPPWLHDYQRRDKLSAPFLLACEVAASIERDVRQGLYGAHVAMLDLAKTSVSGTELAACVIMAAGKKAPLPPLCRAFLDQSFLQEDGQ